MSVIACVEPYETISFDSLHLVAGNRRVMNVEVHFSDFCMKSTGSKQNSSQDSQHWPPPGSCHVIFDCPMYVSAHRWCATVLKSNASWSPWERHVSEPWRMTTIYRNWSVVISLKDYSLAMYDPMLSMESFWTANALPHHSYRVALKSCNMS